ncbi:S26 family signal peptidase [Streptomyces sp. NPDC126510]|uniref:S26 family signal peptidase n=1 Tax=Streptomyces sp. NPDC126510 TaxID=3155317 RepID=UPI003323CD23
MAAALVTVCHVLVAVVLAASAVGKARPAGFRAFLTTLADMGPPGRMAVLGDNAALSTDSRTVGLVPVGAVVAVVFGGHVRPPATGRDGGPGATDAPGRHRGRQEPPQ